jgi:hypothetical protein
MFSKNVIRNNIPKFCVLKSFGYHKVKTRSVFMCGVVL